MSALGQEQAFGPINAMSALPPKADIVQHGGDVALCQKRTFNDRWHFQF